MKQVFIKTVLYITILKTIKITVL